MIKAFDAVQMVRILREAPIRPYHRALDASLHYLSKVVNKTFGQTLPNYHVTGRLIRGW